MQLYRIESCIPLRVYGAVLCGPDIQSLSTHNLGTARKSVGTMPRHAKNSRHFPPQARLVHAWLREDPGIPRLTRRITRRDRHAPAPPDPAAYLDPSLGRANR